MNLAAELMNVWIRLYHDDNHNSLIWQNQPDGSRQLMTFSKYQDARNTSDIE